ncbi:MAG: Ig-like domain-containing protein [Gammaproteobacteria bacterium]|nr:Ig-like domain-containing protein [Gammaproteobacteria bacterium]MBL6999725.1 Ig-like domain-containing protein [Gammaproteobacteria bacterium]
MSLGIKSILYGVLFPVLLLLSACGGGGGSTTTNNDFPLDQALSAELVSQGIPEDIAQFFAAARFSSSCASNTSCSYVYTYPNGARRNLTLTTTPVEYTPTADELSSTTAVINPVYNGRFTASGIEDSESSADAQINISYFVPTSSISQRAAFSALTTTAARSIVVTLAAGASGGYQFNLSESASKGADVTIGSLLSYYESLGKSVKATGSAYAIASALSDIAGAAAISKQVNAWLNELDELEKCAADPTNPVTQSDPSYTQTTVASLQAARAELKQLSAVRFINVMDETAMGLHPVAAVLSIPLKQANAWTEQTLQDLSEKLMQDARSSVVSCKPSCPTGLAANGVSESQIDLSWNPSVSDNEVTGYIIDGGNANGSSTSATTFSDNGLDRSTTYCYTVSAYNDYGTAESCAQACATTFGPPEIHSTGPIHNATGVSVKAIVTAIFSKAVDSATVTSSGTFTLAGSAGAIGGSVSYSGTTASFTPSADLAYSTTYTATVTTAVMDLDGIAMEANHSWSFTTEAAPVAGNLQFNLDMTDILVSGSANVTWTLFEDLGDVRRHVPSGTITADISISGCDTLHAAVPIHDTGANGPGPTLVVYTASNLVFPKSYQFAMAADPTVILHFNCGDTVISTPAPISFLVGFCTSVEFVPFINEAQLAGTFSCAGTGLVNATWDFSN